MSTSTVLRLPYFDFCISMAILLGTTRTLIVLYVPAYLVIIIRNTYDMLRTVTLGASLIAE